VKDIDEGRVPARPPVEPWGAAAEETDGGFLAAAEEDGHAGRVTLPAEDAGDGE
jgi:hypothetical protein